MDLTSPAIPDFSVSKLNHYLRMRARDGARDRRMEMVRQVRNGNMRQLFPDELNLSLSFDGVPIANFVDIVAHDMAEVIAPLPSLACVAGKMKTDADQKRAETKNRIGDSYWQKSKLELQMLKGGDRYVTYGFLPFFIEPDVDNKTPFIHLEDPRNAYYELDRYGRCSTYAKRWLRSIDDLCAMFPEYDSQIRTNDDGKNESGDTEIEFVRWVDKDRVSLILPSRRGLVLRSYQHKLSRLPVHIAERPGLDDSPRGQFDDVIWVQVARAIMTTLTLEAANTAVQAPIVLPDDMDELPIGPNSVYQTSNPQGAHRLNLELPQGVFAENQVLDQELKTGSRYPDARTGQSTASVITGKGVEALLGTFDTQVKGAQMVMKQAFEMATEICFEMDEVWWPNTEKTVNGTLSGQSYELAYTPKTDIAGRWGCTVTYGFAAGMHPSQSIITMLQLEGAGLIAKGTTQENLPFSLDHMQEQKKIDVEGFREALKQGIFGLVQSAGPMAAQGQDAMSTIQLAVDAIRALQNGKTVEDSVQSAFQTKSQAEQAAAQRQQEQAQAQAAAAPPGADGGGGAPPGVEGVAPGQAGMAPGGQPTVSSMVAGFRGDAALPVMSASINRKQATGTQ